MFMTYAKLKWMTDDYHLTAAMDRIAECGGLAMSMQKTAWPLIILKTVPYREGKTREKFF